MSAHTPGPWSVGGPHWYKTVLLNADGKSIASGGNNRVVVGKELEASLVLASAATELLAALEKAVARQGFTNDELISARAAIAKATRKGVL